MRRGILVAAWLCLALSPAVSAHADLEVGIPPGTPLDWSFELPLRQPDPHRGPVPTELQRGAEVKEEETKAPRGPTVVRRTTQAGPPALPRLGSFGALGMARILTLDITAHLPWTTWTGTDAMPGERGYPPRVRADLHWLTLSLYLRKLMHPARVSLAETAQYLILIGSPVREVLDASGRELSRLELTEYLERNIPPTPPAPPDPAPFLAGVVDRELRMLIAWAAGELTSDHLHAWNPLYARRTLSLGGEAIPAVLACARSAHPLLRASAAGILSAYDTPDEQVRKALLQLARSGDPVARNRALQGLLRYGDPEMEAFLIEALAGKDRPFAVHAIRLLGRLGSSRAREKVLGTLYRDQRDRGDVWLAAVGALSRWEDHDGAARKALKKLRGLCARLPRSLRFEEVGGELRPDVPDLPGDRAMLLSQAAMIALARLGDDQARKELLGELRGARKLDLPPALQALAPDPVLERIQPFNQLMAIEALTLLEDEGRAVLRRVVEESREMAPRACALDHLVRMGKEDELVLKLARDEKLPSVLRVQAMESLDLTPATREAAIGVALSMVESYLAGRDRPGADREKDSRAVPAHECLSAVKLLGKRRPLPVETLLRLLDRARENGDHECFRQEAAGRPRRRSRPGMVQEVSLEAFPALYETAVVELGRTGDPQGIAPLRRILEKADGPGRPEAATALGNFPVQEACDSLIWALEDDEPWVRYVAYRALRRIAGEDHFADWLLGKPEDRREAVQRWKAWRAAKGVLLHREEELIAEKRARRAKQASGKEAGNP